MLKDADPAPEFVRDHFPGAMAKLSRLWRRAIDAKLQPTGLTEATWLPLLHISRAKATMRQKDLAQTLGLDNSSVVRILRSLEAADYVARQEAGADRRAKTLTLTATGETIVAQVELVIREARRQWLADISDAELTAAFKVISRLTDVVSSAVEYKS